LVSFLFRHHLPFGNEGFAVAPGSAVTVGFMSTTDKMADPMITSLASVLSVPLFELYALLWRVGVVEIVEPGQARGRASRFVSRVAPGPRQGVCPDPSAHGSRRRSPERPYASSGRSNRAAYIPAVS
jgi:hypothetical protein